MVRWYSSQAIVVAVNAASNVAEVPLRLSDDTRRLVDVLNNRETFNVTGGRRTLPVHPMKAHLRRPRG